MYAKMATDVQLATEKPWHKHVNLIGKRGGSNLRVQCIHCGNEYTGSRSRLVQHLAGKIDIIFGYYKILSCTFLFVFYLFSCARVSFPLFHNFF